MQMCLCEGVTYFKKPSCGYPWLNLEDRFDCTYIANACSPVMTTNGKKVSVQSILINSKEPIK